MRVKEVSEAGGKKGGKERGQAAYIATETSSSRPTSCPPHTDSLPPASVALTNPQQEENVAPRPPEPRRRFQEEVLRYLCVTCRGFPFPQFHFSSRTICPLPPAAAALRRGLVQVVTRFSSPEKDPLHSLPRPLGPHRRSGPIGSPRAGTGVLWR